MAKHAAEHRTRVAIVGAGIVGACIAYELVKRGAKVTLIDRDEPGRGCSFGNSGAISSASIAPLAMPGIVASAMKMLRDPEGALRLPLSYLPRVLPWLQRFVASATPERVEESARILTSLLTNAVQNHVRLAREVGVPELVLCRGHLLLYRDEVALAQEKAAWRLRERHGVRFEEVDRAGILALEPAIGSQYNVGVFLPDEATVVNPYRYVLSIVKAFVARGGTLVKDRVVDLQPDSNRRWRCRGEAQTHDADHVVVAAGIWSTQLLKPLGLDLPLESHRGYHVTFKDGRAPVTRTVVLTDKRIFATPMEEGFRVGGMLEFGGISRPPHYEYSAMLARIARDTFADAPMADESYWMGHRPCLPDSVPCIGPVTRRPGLWLALGHGHLGLTGSINTALKLAPQLLA